MASLALATISSSDTLCDVMAKEPITLPCLFSILAVMFARAFFESSPPMVKNGITVRPSKFDWYMNELIAGVGLEAQIGEPINTLSYCFKSTSMGLILRPLFVKAAKLPLK